MSTNDIRFVEVGEDFDPAHLEGFIYVYQRAFNEAPYFEPYEGEGNTAENVTAHVWTPHLRDGCIVLALEGNLVVGLGCCMRVDQWLHDDAFQTFIHDNIPHMPDVPEKTCFMSEVAVRSSHRRKGIGSQLILDRINWGRRLGFTNYLMRTADEGSNSKAMYKKLGARVIPDLVQDVTTHAEKVGSASQRRIFIGDWIK